jgi:hypothetical protein
MESRPAAPGHVAAPHSLIVNDRDLECLCENNRRWRTWQFVSIGQDR